MARSVPLSVIVGLLLLVLPRVSAVHEAGGEPVSAADAPASRSLYIDAAGAVHLMGEPQHLPRSDAVSVQADGAARTEAGGEAVSTADAPTSRRSTARAPQSHQRGLVREQSLPVSVAGVVAEQHPMGEPQHLPRSDAFVAQAEGTARTEDAHNEAKHNDVEHAQGGAQFSVRRHALERVVETIQDAEDLWQRVGVREISCKCEPFSKAWKASPQRAPASVYFDLGANKGDTFPPTKSLVKVTNVSWNCAHDFAYLFEANSAFTAALAGKLETCPSHVETFIPTAVANCDGSAKLYPSATRRIRKGLDVGSTVRKDKTFDVNYTKSTDVAAVNLMRMLQENTLAEDTVVIKLDIEGGEFDLIPCLVNSPMAKHIDHLILERHDSMMKLDADTVKAFNSALDKLRAMGVHVNDGWI